MFTAGNLTKIDLMMMSDASNHETIMEVLILLEASFDSMRGNDEKLEMTMLSTKFPEHLSIHWNKQRAGF